MIYSSESYQLASSKIIYSQISIVDLLTVYLKKPKRTSLCILRTPIHNTPLDLQYKRALHKTNIPLMRRSNCSAPIPPPPGTPGDITYFGVAPVSLSLYFSLAPPYINTLITLFSSAPPLFITHIFPLTPWLRPGGDGGTMI